MQPSPRYYGPSELKSERAYLEARDRMEWEDHKRIITGRKGKVSDDDFMRFRNAQTGAKPPRSKRLPPIVSLPEPDNKIPEPDDENTL